MTTKERIVADLNRKDILARIDKIVNTTPSPLYDMILLAEYLEQKWDKGYVVYWCTAGEPRFEVSTANEYDPNKFWVGHVHWATNLAHKEIFGSDS